MSIEDESKWNFETSAPKMSLSTCVSGNLRVRCHKSSSLPSRCAFLQLPAAGRKLLTTRLSGPSHSVKFIDYKAQSSRVQLALTAVLSSLHCTTNCYAAPNFRLQLIVQRKQLRNREQQSSESFCHHGGAHSPVCQSVYLTVMCSWVLLALPQDGAEWQQSIRVINM